MLQSSLWDRLARSSDQFRVGIMFKEMFSIKFRIFFSDVEYEYEIMIKPGPFLSEITTRVNKKDILLIDPFSILLTSMCQLNVKFSLKLARYKQNLFKIQWGAHSFLFPISMVEVCAPVTQSFPWYFGPISPVYIKDIEIGSV